MRAEQNTEVSQRQTRPSARLALRRLSWLLAAGAVTLMGFPLVTIVEAHRASGTLRNQYSQLMQSTAAAPAAAAAATSYKTLALAFANRARSGDAVGKLSIPAIRISAVFVQGSRSLGTDGVDPTLHGGPGHIFSSAWPGQGNNVAIAGHRTTYTHPFWSLDRVRRGDLIELSMPYGHFTYRVRLVEEVAPSNVTVAGLHGRDELTLSTCTPRFTAARRLIVHADHIATTPPRKPAK